MSGAKHGRPWRVTLWEKSRYLVLVDLYIVRRMPFNMASRVKTTYKKACFVAVITCNMLVRSVSTQICIGV
jgi:hypothetical protein